MQTNEKDAGGGVGIRLKLGSLFSPRASPAAGKAKEDVDHGTFITADVLRVSGRGRGRGLSTLLHRSWSRECPPRGG